METVNLYTQFGEFVTSVTLPEFRPRVEILSWGQRMFHWVEAEGEYRESVIWVTDVLENNRQPNPAV